MNVLCNRVLCLVLHETAGSVPGDLQLAVAEQGRLDDRRESCFEFIAYMPSVLLLFLCSFGSCASFPIVYRVVFFQTVWLVCPFVFVVKLNFLFTCSCIIGHSFALDLTADE
jgi:hypothetical protein